MTNAVLPGHEVNPRLLAALRVAVGVVALLRGLGLVIKTLDAPGGDVGPAHAAGIAVWIGLALLVILGWRARVAAGAMVLLWFGLVVADSDFFYKNHNYLIVLGLFLVTLSDCERHYALLRRGAGPVSGWPLLLLRWQVSIVYLFAGLAKVNRQFLSGDVLTSYMDRALLPLPVPGTILSSGEFMVALSITVVGMELFLAIAVWSGRLRPVAFGLALPLHAGMVLATGPFQQFFGILLFGSLMLALLAAFLEVPARARLVVWDDSCSSCRRWVAVFRRLDAFGALRFAGSSSREAYDGTGVTPEAAAQALQLVEPDGTVRGGFSAVQGILAVIPGGYLVAPYMSLPGVRQAGNAAYRRVAAGRTCALDAPHPDIEVLTAAGPSARGRR